jgi:hypothetical protein
MVPACGYKLGDVNTAGVTVTMTIRDIKTPFDLTHG